VASHPKGALAEGRTILFVDQTGFSLFPPVVRTYAPRGNPPVLIGNVRREHLSAIGALTLAGELARLSVQRSAVTGADMRRFLQQLLRERAGPLTIIWDGAPIHRSPPVRELLASPAGQRLRLEQLPSYAPELNPAEGIWAHLKGHELANVRCDELGQLWREVHQAKQRLRAQPHVLRGCVKQPGCYL
jgi:transposase